MCGRPSNVSGLLLFVRQSVVVVEAVVVAFALITDMCGVLAVAPKHPCSSNTTANMRDRSGLSSFWMVDTTFALEQDVLLSLFVVTWRQQQWMQRMQFGGSMRPLLVAVGWSAGCVLTFTAAH